jgi:hypothetical protein
MRNYIWLDDVRQPPHVCWLWVKSVQEAISIMDNLEGEGPIVLAFDHDLGENEPTGYDLAKHIEATAAQGSPYAIIEWHIHSANPAGARNIKAAMESFDRIMAKNLDNPA